jgi:hypothetical protein
LAIPSKRIGLGVGLNNQERKEIPERKKITKKIRTSIIKANFATILFEFKNSLEPSKTGNAAGKDGISNNGFDVGSDPKVFIIYNVIKYIYNIVFVFVIKK